MKDTYCGKICEGCTERENINCGGCDGKCDIAKCCIHRERENCEGCAFRSSCVILEKAPTMASYRQKYDQIAQKAPFLKKWYSYLFYLVVPNVIASIMTNSTFETNAPGVYFVGNILSIIVTLIYGYILLQLSKEEIAYKAAAICRFAALAISVVVILTDAVAIGLIIGIASIIIMFLGEYKEYKGHEAILVGIDDELSKKWNKLWMWYIGVIVAVIFGIFFMFISIVLGALVVIAGVIGVIVVSITKLMYIYRMAEKFEEYC